MPSRSTGGWTKAIALFALACWAPWLAWGNANSAIGEQGRHAPKLLIILGAAGESHYQEVFDETAQKWRDLAEKAGSPITLIGVDDRAETDSQASDKERIQQWIAQMTADPPQTAWIVYIGHGSFDGIESKLNLRGPDLSSIELREELETYDGPLVFVHGGSASVPFLTELSGPNRIIISATKSGFEANYARFGELFTSALASSESDLDLDGEVSLLEAFITASRRVETFYLERGRLATEHALLDDNGDGKGITFESFDGLRPRNSDDEEPPDGARAKRTTLLPSPATLALTDAQLQRRDALEEQLDELRTRKDKLSETVYLKELEKIFLQLAELYLPQSPASDATPSDS